MRSPTACVSRVMPRTLVPPRKRTMGRADASGVFVARPIVLGTLRPSDERHPGAPLIEAREIVKRYGTVLANDRVDFSLRAERCTRSWGRTARARARSPRSSTASRHPTAGPSGSRAGLSEVRSPRAARALGIGMVFQNFMLIPALSVSENISLFLSDLPVVVRPRAVARRIRELRATGSALRWILPLPSASSPLETSRRSRSSSCSWRTRGS